MKLFATLAVIGATLTPLSLLGVAAHAKPAAKSKSAKVHWQPSYYAAMKAAKRSGKPMFIDFYTDWCGPCKYLDKTTYQDAKFIAYSRVGLW